VSNSSTVNQRISTPAHLLVVQIGKCVSSDFMVQIKQKGVYRVENSPPRSFVGGEDSKYRVAKTHRIP